ncbi:MAG: hypothetical protein H0V80_09390 [Acidobacteria bacterium]|nr:hypothetical protein [Acidobacteriota bacterium]
MIRPVLTTTLWLAGIDALSLLAAAAFLYTPESNLLMLLLSVALVVVAAVAAMLSSSSAAWGLVHGRSPWHALRPSLRMLPLLLVALVVIGLLCGGAGWFEQWWLRRAGEVDAALIAAGDVTRTRWLHASVRWCVALVQWVLVPAWLASSLTWAAAYGGREMVSLKWLTAGLDWRLLLVTLAGVIVLVWLPWGAVYWRPRTLPASTIEVAFTAIKLGIIYLATHLAWTLALWTAARSVQPAPGTGGFEGLPPVAGGQSPAVHDGTPEPEPIC